MTCYSTHWLPTEFFGNRRRQMYRDNDLNFKIRRRKTWRSSRTFILYPARKQMEFSVSVDIRYLIEKKLTVLYMTVGDFLKNDCLIARHGRNLRLGDCGRCRSSRRRLPRGMASAQYLSTW
jgi:tRNA A-37 threonylcarbamoyl transferase component Bud32